MTPRRTTVLHNHARKARFSAFYFYRLSLRSVRFVPLYDYVMQEISTSGRVT